MDTAPIPSAPDNDADAANSLSRILALYRSATSSFLLRQLAAAYATSLEALALLSQTNLLYRLDHALDSHTRRPFLVLKQKLWVLNTAIFGAILADRVAAKDSHNSDDDSDRHRDSNAHNTFACKIKKSLACSQDASKESPELLLTDLWRRLVDDYGGLEGDVDGKVMVSIALLCVDHSLFLLARQITEAYLVSIPEDMLIHLEAAAGAQVDTNSTTKDSAMIDYERLTELYVVHILAKLGDWDSARDFVDLNTVLSLSSKKVYARTLEKLYRKSRRPKTSAKKPGVSTRAVDLEDCTSTASSANSTLVSSPTLSSLPLPFSRKAMQSTDILHSNVETPTDTTMHRQWSKVTSISTTVQGQLRMLVQRYTELMQRIGDRIGPNQLMMMVALIVLLAAVSRNRARAKTATGTVIQRLVQSIKGVAATGT